METAIATERKQDIATAEVASATQAEPQNTSDLLDEFRPSNEIFTPSNIISIMRVMLVLPAVFAMWDRSNFLVGVIFVLAFMSDLFDGWLARKYNAVSELGKVIDPLADKIFIAGVVIAMVYFGFLPIWFVATILLRDLVIVAAGVWATQRFKVVLPSNYPGKGAVLAVSLTLFLIMCGVSKEIVVFMEGLSVALMLISLAVYGRRLLELARAVPAA